VVLPGLFDTHTHFGGTSCPEIQDDLAAFAPGYFPIVYERFACAVRMARDALCAGVTRVREVGSDFSQPLAHVLASGMYPGPHFHYASFALGITGGHADEQYEDLDAFASRHSSGAYHGKSGLCDGPADCVRRVREQLRAQSDVIKVMATGGVLSAFDQPVDQELSYEEVRAVVEEAARARREVAAHCHGARGIANAIRAGVRTIEHGSYGNLTLWQQAKAAGVRYTPTISITQTFNASVRPSDYDKRQWAKGQEVLQHHTRSVRAAVEAGVTITTGTDCPFGSCAGVAGEVAYLHDLFGLSSLEALRAATADAPLAMGDLGMAPLSGQLRRGYVADVLAMDVDPLKDIHALTKPEHITHVWKAGALFKRPGNAAAVCGTAGLHALPRR